MGRLQMWVILGISSAVMIWLNATLGMKWALMALVGLGLGFTLAFSRFGIVFGWREMITKRNSYYVRVHLITITIEILLFTIFLSFSHALFGDKMVGNIMGIGVPFLIGAIIFGIGMQLAGVCATGTLYCCGEGKPRFWFIFIFYGIGTLISNHFRPFLEATFTSPIIVDKDFTGSAWTGMLINLCLLCILFCLFRHSDKNHNRQISSIFAGHNLFWKDGRFTVLTGGIIIAILNSTVVALHGSAWTITDAVYVMSVHCAGLFGFYKDNPILTQPIFLNPMVGMFWLGILGAALARSLTVTQQAATPTHYGQMLASIIGGLFMGMGAMYSACNLGGMFDGIASGSLHGWIWMFMALFGSIIGIKLRPKFGLSNA